MLAKLLQSARYVNLVGVIALLLAAMAALGWASLKSLTTIMLIINSGAQDAKIPIALIEVVDSFLITTALFVFAFPLLWSRRCRRVGRPDCLDERGRQRQGLVTISNCNRRIQGVEERCRRVASTHSETNSGSRSITS